MKLVWKIIITLSCAALLALSQLGVVDHAGALHTEEGLKRALVTYGISRGLNGVISVAQGTEVAIEPVGVGVTFTPGQILDPVNDLIERFSTVVLVSGTAFGVQNVFLDLVSSPTFSRLGFLLVAWVLCMMWFIRQRNHTAQPFFRVAARAAAIFLIIRFSVPVMAVGSEQLYQVFLAPQFKESSEQLLSTTDQLNDMQATANAPTDESEEEKSLLQSARDFYNSATSTFDMQQHLDDFKVAAETISEHAIKLIVVFVFQTIVLPLGSVWLTFKAIKWVAIRKWHGSDSSALPEP